MTFPFPTRTARWTVASLVGIGGFAASVWWAQHTFGQGFMPHGYCISWIPALLWLHVISDSLIALAYLSIPVTLLYFVRRRPDLPFGPMYLLFGAFIVACGGTHLLDVWTLWHADYWLSGGVKALTAAVSVCTALALVVGMPRALAIPSVQQLEQAKAALEEEVRARRQVEAELRQAQAELEARVAQRTAALAEANALLDGLFDAVPAGIAVFDDADRYVRVNPALGRINGAPVAAHAGRTLAEMLPGLAPQVAAQLAEVRATGRPLLGLEVVGHAAGPAPNSPPVPSHYAVSYFPVPGPAGALQVGAICEDITQRRLAEAERVRLLNDAQEANRLKGEFVAHASHELRTPLQAMLSWVALLKSGRLDAAAAARAFERLEHNVRLQSRMISELLNAARDSGPGIAERAATAQALGALGARVALAPAPKEAAMLLRGGSFDVLVSDLRLADGATGYDVLRQVRQLDGQLPAIALSAYGSETDLAATRAAGFERHLVKPVDAVTLADAVLALVPGGRRTGG